MFLCTRIARPLRQLFPSKSARNVGTSLFDADTQLRQLQGEGQFETYVSNAWSVGDAPNGGYLSCICMNAALQV